MTRPAILAAWAMMLVAPAILAADQPEYPKAVEKKLWADDVRGKPAPQLFVERWLTDKPRLKGKVVLIDFWATWCPPCRQTIPELNEFAEHYKNDLVVIGISAEPATVLQDFMKKTEMKYAVASDTTQQMYNAIHVIGIPHVLIISTDGIVRWQGYPLSAEEPLTKDIIKQVIRADPGVAARHKAAESPATQP